MGAWQSHRDVGREQREDSGGLQDPATGVGWVCRKHGSNVALIQAPNYSSRKPRQSQAADSPMWTHQRAGDANSQWPPEEELGLEPQLTFHGCQWQPGDSGTVSSPSQGEKQTNKNRINTLSVQNQSRAILGEGNKAYSDGEGYGILSNKDCC